MKQAFALLLLVALLSTAHADDAPPPRPEPAAKPALEVLPQHLGYAFEQPEILIRQRLFGLAHGLSMLAAACLDLPEHSTPIQNAYASWHARQGKTIETLVHDLARYYFDARADEAQWPDLVRALNLKDTIQPALGELSLHVACTSLPEAIVRPRYALDKLLAGTPEPEIPPIDVVAPPPAPTIQKPAE